MSELSLVAVKYSMRNLICDFGKLLC